MILTEKEQIPKPEKEIAQKKKIPEEAEETKYYGSGINSAAINANKIKKKKRNTKKLSLWDKTGLFSSLNVLYIHNLNIIPGLVVLAVCLKTKVSFETF